MHKNDSGQMVFDQNDLREIKARLRVERGLPPESVQRRRFEQTLFDEFERLKKKYPAAAQQEQDIASSCGYQGKHFGAIYEDGGCIDGYLWDLDSCDDTGSNFSSGGDIPCPQCNSEKYAAYCADEQQEREDGRT